jgi:hypothetical protein
MYTTDPSGGEVAKALAACAGFVVHHHRLRHRCTQALADAAYQRVAAAARGVPHQQAKS